jgi:hypothetical protein
MTDKLSTLTANVARLLDGTLALPADADREQAALDLADGLITEAIVVLPGAVAELPQELHIAGFTIAHCDDGSVYLEADNRPGEEGVSVRKDYLSSVLSTVYEVAKQPSSVACVPCSAIVVTDSDSALDALDIPEDDLAARVVDREVSFDDGADCEGCKI